LILISSLALALTVPEGELMGPLFLAWLGVGSMGGERRGYATGNRCAKCGKAEGGFKRRLSCWWCSRHKGKKMKRGRGERERGEEKRE